MDPVQDRRTDPVIHRTGDSLWDSDTEQHRRRNTESNGHYQSDTDSKSDEFLYPDKHCLSDGQPYGDHVQDTKSPCN
jgi:hypothetical protein